MSSIVRWEVRAIAYGSTRDGAMCCQSSPGISLSISMARRRRRQVLAWLAAAANSEAGTQRENMIVVNVEDTVTYWVEVR